MIQISGTYENGKIILDKDIAIANPVRVIVSFADEDVVIQPKRLTINNFSFLESRELLKDLKISLLDAVIEERRSGL